MIRLAKFRISAVTSTRVALTAKGGDHRINLPRRILLPAQSVKHLIMLSTRSSSEVRRLSVFASVEAAQEAAKAAKETSTAKTILAAKAAEAVEATKAAAAEEAKVAAELVTARAAADKKVEAAEKVLADAKEAEAEAAAALTAAEAAVEATHTQAEDDMKTRIAKAKEAAAAAAAAEAAAEDDKGGAGGGKLTAAPSKLRTISFGIRSTAQKKKVAKLHTSLTTSISEEDPEDTEIKRAEPSFRRAVAKAEKSLAPGAGAPAAGVAKSMMATLIAAEGARPKGAARRRATMQWANAKGGEMTATPRRLRITARSRLDRTSLSCGRPAP